MADEFAIGDQVTWDRGELGKGEGTIIAPEIDPRTKKPRYPQPPDGWHIVRDERNNIYAFPPEQLKKLKAKRETKP